MGSATKVSHRVIGASVWAATALFAGFFALAASTASAKAADAGTPGATAPDPSVDPDEAHPGAGIEPLYADALIASHRGNRGAALAALKELLRRAPTHAEGLALQAQIYQASGNDPEAIQSYLKLIKLKVEEPRLSYFKFELAYAYHRLKQYDSAKPLLQQVIDQGFNVAGCNLLLGIADFQSGKLADAEVEFERARASSEPTTGAPARYYLAMTEYQLGFDGAGTRQAYEAYRLAISVPTAQAPKGIAAATLKLLDKIAGPAWFGSLSLTGHYDSNIAIVPGQNLSSGIAAEKLELGAGIGRMSAAAADYQWVASLRFSGNLNFPSASTSSFEYETLAPSFYLNHAPLSPMPWGLKLEGSFTAQGQTSGFRFPFLLGADFGGFVKVHPGVRSELSLDVGARPQNYVPADATGFSGTPLYARFSANKETLWQLVNPSASIQLETASTTDPTNSYRLVALQAGNTFKLGARDRLTAVLDLGFYTYPNAGRSDSNITPRLTWLHPVGTSLSVLADLWYASNTSTVPDIYSYTRLVLGGGVNYTF